eukprot:173609-Pelagomonas_calceolata.AAC.1
MPTDEQLRVLWASPTSIPVTVMSTKAACFRATINMFVYGKAMMQVKAAIQQLMCEGTCALDEDKLEQLEKLLPTK